MVISTEPNNNELSTLLLRCRTMEEVKLLAFAYYLRAVSEGGLVVLTDEKNKVAAQAWLFD
ncbi:hypothetical protein OH491_01315 [Termitidicoccus mucosus]|uniref:Uncharacterized protein n=1 Tax=Termitidicoccus mucosus TaxID=1184151 RepID=A0A178IKT3_9BACT|nr:hypothetical protein AW736_08225 [Opitutaceae bacterium TSB47]OAM91848.1 hypothetical protein AW736_26680 [Opitutaceae bacterium TSB47]